MDVQSKLPSKPIVGRLTFSTRSMKRSRSSLLWLMLYAMFISVLDRFYKHNAKTLPVILLSLLSFFCFFWTMAFPVFFSAQSVRSFLFCLHLEIVFDIRQARSRQLALHCLKHGTEMDTLHNHCTETWLNSLTNNSRGTKENQHWSSKIFLFGRKSDGLCNRVTSLVPFVLLNVLGIE